MGRRATWLVIAAVACLAAVAIADAVRDSDAGEPQAAAPTTAAPGQDPLRAQVGAGLRGVLYDRPEVIA